MKICVHCGEYHTEYEFCPICGSKDNVSDEDFYDYDDDEVTEFDYEDDDNV